MWYYIICWIGLIAFAVAGYRYVQEVKRNAEYDGWERGYDQGYSEGYKRATKDVKIEVVDLT